MLAIIAGCFPKFAQAMVICWHAFALSLFFVCSLYFGDVCCLFSLLSFTGRKQDGCRCSSRSVVLLNARLLLAARVLGFQRACGSWTWCGGFLGAPEGSCSGLARGNQSLSWKWKCKSFPEYPKFFQISEVLSNDSLLHNCIFEALGQHITC